MSVTFMPPPLFRARRVKGSARRIVVSSTGVYWPLLAHPRRPSSAMAQMWLLPSVPLSTPMAVRKALLAWVLVRASTSITVFCEPTASTSSPSLTSRRTGYCSWKEPVPSSKSPLVAFQCVRGPTSVAMWRPQKSAANAVTVFEGNWSKRCVEVTCWLLASMMLTPGRSEPRPS